MGLIGLAATGICSMLGASIYVVPIMIQRNVPGIGPWVLPAFLFASVPALLAAISYAILASAMPRAGGSYVYASRGLHPYLGFVASFSQWFGLCIAIGVVSYVIVPFFRDIAGALGADTIAALLESGLIRLLLALALLWFFVWVNIRGVRFYERIIIPLMVLMFALGVLVIVAGFTFTHTDFATALQHRTGQQVPSGTADFSLTTFLSAAAVLFSSFIGFDSIAQAGGEAQRPSRNMPLAIGIAITTVGGFYFVFTSAIYHAVPWQFVAAEANLHDVTAPGLMTYLLPAGWTVAMVAGAAVALTNDLPAMLLSVSRLMFAWAEDGIFPQGITRTHPVHRTPVPALLISGAVASLSILGCHFAGDFFLGIDILVTSMLVNFILMTITVMVLPRRNPAIAQDISVVRNRLAQWVLASAGLLALSAFLVIHVYKDLTASTGAWYTHATVIWIVVMLVASLIFFREIRRMKKAGRNVAAIFSELPAA
ncbi:MAG: APC family permease [Cyclobacteriaceae bacterium]|nr:APC family permease [Cyclobacteriaceae bacterium]